MTGIPNDPFACVQTPVRGSFVSDPFSPIHAPVPPPKSPSGRTEVVPGSATESVPDACRIISIVNERGHLCDYKMESGVLVMIKDRGHVKKQAELAIYRAANEKVRVEALTPEQLSQMTNIEAAALNLARRAALGDGQDVDRLLDRLVGKPKQSSETVNLNLTLDDILMGDDEDEEPAEKPRPVYEVEPDPNE